MTASLLVASIETINRAVNDNVRLASGFDFGEGTPDQATIGSLYLDGEAVVGDRTGNRQIQLPLNVYGTSASDISATVEAFRSVVNAATFEIQWTPDGGLPIVFDCFRATVTRVRNPDLDAAGGPARLMLTCPAKPFGRSTVAETPSLTTVASTTHGAAFSLAGLVGSARAPVNLELSTGGSFTRFLLHTPPVTQDTAATILLALSATSALQTVSIAASSAKHRGTYSIVLGGATDGTAGTIQVSVTQKENGVQVGNPWTTQPTEHDITTQGLFFVAGEVTLPIYDTPSDNTKTSYDIEVNISAGTDRYSEVMLCDTAGQTIFVDQSLTTSREIVYVDEPSPLQSGPSVFISATDRTEAWSTLGDCVVSGGPILFEPGGVNKVLAWTDAGTPAVAPSYYPRWLDERLS